MSFMSYTVTHGQSTIDKQVQILKYFSSSFRELILTIDTSFIE